jgi:hypothetical protein
VPIQILHTNLVEGYNLQIVMTAFFSLMKREPHVHAYQARCKLCYGIGPQNFGGPQISGPPSDNQQACRCLEVQSPNRAEFDAICRDAIDRQFKSRIDLFVQGV